MKKWVAVLVIYLAGGFLTNSYFFLYRYEEWNEDSKFTAPDGEVHNSGKADIRLAFGTLLWPVYWLSRASTEVVRKAAQIKICTGDSER
jgi:hypothetical protein